MNKVNNNMQINLIECMKTWQGEGPDCGKKMLLTRFAECNLNCSFCDTRIKMDNCVAGDYSIFQIAKTIEDNNLGLMITGGEPTYGDNLGQTVSMLNSIDYTVANVETNGCNLVSLLSGINPDKNFKIMYSPKIFNDALFKTNLNLVKKIADNPKTFAKVYYKIVVSNTDGNNSNTHNFLVEMSNFNIDMNKVFLMPMGTTISQMKESAVNLFDLAEKFNTNITSRSHLVFDYV